MRVTRKHNEDVIKLLTLMGCPIVLAPCEAEAQCAELCKGGKVFAAATEDLDALTFGTPRLVRNLFAAEAAKKPVFEVNLAHALQQLGITMDSFIDFCILCGCDYCDSIKGLGPQNAIRLIIDHKTIEAAVEASERFEPPTPEWLGQLAAVRECFKRHEVLPAAEVDIEPKEPDYEGLRKFMVDENQFDTKRIERSIDRLKAARVKKTQARMDQFFVKAATEIKEADKFDPKKKKAAAKAKAKGKAGAKKLINK